MALANDSILVTPGSGATLATHSQGSKEHQVFIQADADGHLHGTTPGYFLYQQPRVTTAAATDFFDLFNATGSGKIIRIRGIYPVILVTAANAIIPSFQFACYRTSDVGTGGTPSPFEGAAVPITGQLNIARPSTADAGTLPAQITARALPTGGATAAAFLFSIALLTEETNASTYLVQGINFVPQFADLAAIELQENQGFKIRQITATASTGCSFGWLVVFGVIP